MTFTGGGGEVLFHLVAGQLLLIVEVGDLTLPITRFFRVEVAAHIFEPTVVAGNPKDGVSALPERDSCGNQALSAAPAA